MHETQSWFAGVDWASQKHDVWLADASGKRLGKRTFAHSGEGLAQMCAWLIATSGGKPENIHVAIEVPHGPVVETLLDREFKVYAINPRQLDRFRDRFSPAGAKDDSRDAETRGRASVGYSARSTQTRRPAMIHKMSMPASMSRWKQPLSAWWTAQAPQSGAAAAQPILPPLQARFAAMHQSKTYWP